MKSSVQKILEAHVPPQAFSYCLGLWETHPFDLKLSKSRKSKAGDFSCSHSQARPKITLNEDLNPYSFLITYIHEVAHLHVYVNYGSRTEPHGKIWKHVFQTLMKPLLTSALFPIDVLSPLMAHMANPAASSYSDPVLSKALARHNHASQSPVFLSDIPEGSTFCLHGRYFKKGKLKRSRFVCLEVRSKKNYLISEGAPVHNIQLALL